MIPTDEKKFEPKSGPNGEPDGKVPSSVALLRSLPGILEEQQRQRRPELDEVKRIREIFIKLNSVNLMNDYNWDNPRVESLYQPSDRTQHNSVIITSIRNFDRLKFTDFSAMESPIYCGSDRQLACNRRMDPEAGLLKSETILPTFQAFSQRIQSVDSLIPRKLQINSGKNIIEVQEILYTGVAEHEAIHSSGRGEYYGLQRMFNFYKQHGLCKDPTQTDILATMLSRYDLASYVASVLDLYQGTVSQKMLDMLPGGKEYKNIMKQALEIDGGGINDSENKRGTDNANMSEAVKTAIRSGVNFYYTEFFSRLPVQDRPKLSTLAMNPDEFLQIARKNFKFPL